jgi:hypothetical protein
VISDEVYLLRTRGERGEENLRDEVMQKDTDVTKRI